MAITWNTQITNPNVSSKRADVSFTREDSDKPNDTFSVSYRNTIISGNTPAETTAVRVALLDSAWNAWQAEIASRSNIETLLSNLENAANTNLQAREV